MLFLFLYYMSKSTKETMAAEIAANIKKKGFILYKKDLNLCCAHFDDTAIGRIMRHINEYVKTRGFLNVFAINARAEEYARNHRESYDIAIARAVASLNVLLELCLPLVKVDGYFIAMKGAKVFEEIEEAKNALKELDSEIVEIMEVNLPESGEKRILILIQKKKKTKSRYPREYKDISNKPL